MGKNKIGDEKCINHFTALKVAERRGKTWAKIKLVMRNVLIILLL